MKKLSALLVVCTISLLSTACTRIGPGYVGIKVSMAGDDKGVSSAVSTTGWQFYNPAFSSVFEFPTFTQPAVVWTQNPNEGSANNEEITFSNADQMQIACDVSLSYHIDPAKVPEFYVKFRSDNMDTFTHGPLRNFTRDSFNEAGGAFHIEKIMGDNNEFLAAVKARLSGYVNPIGVVLDQFGVIGICRPPKQVIDAINDKNHAAQLAQQKQNELAQVTADMAKESLKATTYAANRLISADAEATANLKIAHSLTPELVEWKRIDKWNGVQPQVVSGGNAATLFTLGGGK